MDNWLERVEQDGFQEKLDRKGAYISLMEDVLPDMNDDSSDEDILNYELDKQSILDAMDSSCNEFNNALSFKPTQYRLSVGCAGAKSKFIEPCPICYSGTIKKRNIPTFDMVIIGDNPHYEDAYWERNHTWDELSDFYMPIGKLKLKNWNNFTRVLSDLKGGHGYSDYYRFIYLAHQALLEKKVYGTWSKLRKTEFHVDTDDDVVLQKVLDSLYSKPILSLELVPYKSPKTETLDDSFFNNCVNISSFKYKDYLFHLLYLIVKYARDNAWILFPYQGAYDAFKMTLKYLEIDALQNEESFFYELKSGKQLKADIASWKNFHIAHYNFYARGGNKGERIKDFFNHALKKYPN